MDGLPVHKTATGFHPHEKLLALADNVIK